MKLKCFCVNPFGENTYIIWDEFSKNGAIIDPGMCNKKEQQLIDTFVSDNKITLEYNTKHHCVKRIDHHKLACNKTCQPPFYRWRYSVFY